MKSFSVALLVVAVGSGGLLAQIDPPEAHGSAVDYTDGSCEFSWKLVNPSGPSDWWNSFKGTDAAGLKIDALGADWVETAGLAGSHAEIGLYTDLGAGAPDVLAGQIVTVANPAVGAGDGLDSDNFYAIPATTVPSSNVHVAAKFVGGDSHCWMASDTTQFIGRSFFSTNSYATGAIPFSVEIDLYLGTPHAGNPGDLLFNGSTSATVQQNDTVCVDFIGSAPSTLFILYFCVNGNPLLQLLPLAFTQTDHPVFGGSVPGTWQLCTTLSCNTPTASNLEFCTLWADQTDLTAGGKPKIKLGASAFLSIAADFGCDDDTDLCFGIRDDCFMDGNVWKVVNPAGPSDWFNVNHGVSSGSPTLTSLSVSSFDFCGIGPCWAEVGIYPSNLSVDPSGLTPDVGAPLARVTGNSACMAASASDGSCPLTVYDTPDVPAPTSAVHAAVRWPSGDSCIWLGSDTDGVDSPCGVFIPSDGSHSLFTGNGYTSPAQSFTGANWMMQIDWN